MSTLSALSSPLLRRTWICRACIRSQRQTIPQPYGLWQQRSTSAGHNAFASRIGSSRTFASQANEAANATPKAAGRSSKSSKRRTRLLIAGGGIAIGAAVVTVNDDAKHAYVAAQRSYRVVATLVLNIREYVHACIVQRNQTIHG